VTAGVIGTKLRAINSRNKWAKGYSGNTAYRYLRAFFNWTTPQCETLSASPMVELARPKKKEQKGARTPSVDDMLTLWRTMPDPGSLPGLTRVLMVTGARLGEVAGMEWSEILDGEELVWRLPAGRTKEDRAKDIPLSSTAAAIILAQPKIKGCALVFPTSTGRPYKKGAIDKPWKRWFASTAMADVEYFHRHDIRRGVITGLNDYLNAWLAHNKAGVYVRSEVVEEIVGHAGGGHKSGIKAHYNNATYDDERRMALDAWADFLWGKLIADAPDNIVSIKPS
jgi:integrase